MKKTTTHLSKSILAVECWPCWRWPSPPWRARSRRMPSVPCAAWIAPPAAVATELLWTHATQTCSPRSGTAPAPRSGSRRASISPAPTRAIGSISSPQPLGVKALYGGFDGTEGALTERDPATHVTILSGDIGDDDTDADLNNIDETYTDIQGSNSYTVVYISSMTAAVTSTTVLDGFTITRRPGAGHIRRRRPVLPELSRACRAARPWPT